MAALILSCGAPKGISPAPPTTVICRPLSELWKSDNRQRSSSKTPTTDHRLLPRHAFVPPCPFKKSLRYSSLLKHYLV